MADGRVRWAYEPGIPAGRGTVVTVGTFDGVHRGHWAVLQEIRRRALATGRSSVLVTFDPHPLRIVRPEHAPPLLTTPVEKKEILAESGLDYAVFISFTETLSRYEPRRFVEEVLVGRMGVSELVIGYDHGFGRDRSGDVGMLRTIGSELGFAVDVVPPVESDGGAVSSSRIRRAVMEARMGDARAWRRTRAAPRLSDRQPQGGQRGQADPPSGDLRGARGAAIRHATRRASPGTAPDLQGLSPHDRAPSDGLRRGAVR